MTTGSILALMAFMALCLAIGLALALGAFITWLCH